MTTMVRFANSTGVSNRAKVRRIKRSRRRGEQPEIEDTESVVKPVRHCAICKCTLRSGNTGKLCALCERREGYKM